MIFRINEGVFRIFRILQEIVDILKSFVDVRVVAWLFKNDFFGRFN